MTEESSIIHGQCEIYIFKYLVSKIFYCEHTKVKPNYICWLNYLTDVVKKKHFVFFFKQSIFKIINSSNIYWALTICHSILWV